MPPGSEQDQDETRFTWPPRRPVVADPTSQRAPPRHRSPVLPAPARRGVWATFEREILGLTAGPLADRAADAGWVPDSSADYCPRCGQTTEPGDRRAGGGCFRCEGVKLAWDRFVRLGEYRGELRRWVHEVKFTRWRRLGVDLGRRLGESLLTEWDAMGQPGGRARPPILVPVPDSALRRVWRGIDHTGAIVAGVRDATNWPMARPLFRQWGRSQRSVPSSERARNAARSFGIWTDFPWETLAGRVVVIIDDVVTSGATMRACSKLITSACRTETKRTMVWRGLIVWVACVARTPIAEPGHSGRKQG